jgi:hypothetical protein
VKKILILFFLAAFLSCQKKDSKEENPNIVLIMADDLGWSDLSFMGSNYYETPK